jgi:type II secretory pathway pseudopilin PulG
MKSHRRHAPRLRRGSAGFALFEVVLALAILSIGLSALFYVFGDSLRSGRRAYQKAEAASLAQSLLEQIGTERVLRPGSFEGKFPNGYGWRVTIEPFGQSTERQLWPVGAFTVETEVVWQEHTRSQSYKLTTLRFGEKGTSP